MPICHELHRPDLTAAVLASLAWSCTCLGNYAESEHYYRESLTIAESIASPYGIALVTNYLGWVAYCEGGSRLTEALSLYTQAMGIWRQIGQRANLARCLGDYALAACEAGDYAEAARHASEGVAFTEEFQHYDLLSYTLYCLGAAMSGLGNLDAGGYHLRRALQVATQIGQADHSASIFYYLARRSILQSQQPMQTPVICQAKQAEALTWLTLVIGQPTTRQFVRDRALKLQAELATTLPAAVAAAATARGQELTLAQAVTEVLGDTAPQVVPAESR